MKYSEFIKSIKELGFKVCEYGDLLAVEDDNKKFILLVSTKVEHVLDSDLSSFKRMQEVERKVLFNLAVELASTPLDEREDEKKYYVKFMERVYLVYYPKSKNYGVVSKRKGSGGKTQFTEQQIKNLDYRYWEFAEEVKEDE